MEEKKMGQTITKKNQQMVLPWTLFKGTAMPAVQVESSQVKGTLLAPVCHSDIKGSQTF
jgi:hypothetical protein